MIRALRRRSEVYYIKLAGQELKPKTIKIDKEGINDILESKYNKKVKFWNDSRKFEETDN